MNTLKSTGKSGKMTQFLWIGIVASVLMIISDFLLGYVNPTLIGENTMLMEGYGTIAIWRIPLSMALAILALFLYLIPLYKLEETISPNGKWRIIYRGSLMLGTLPWLFVHLYYCMSIYLFRTLSNSLDTVSAYEYSSNLIDAFSPFVPMLYLVMALPFLVFGVAIYRKKTAFPRWFVLTNPIVYYLAFTILKIFLPQNAITSALGMGVLNEGMLLWFLGMLFVEKKYVDTY